MSLWAVEWHDDSPVPGTKARKKRGATRGARDCLRFVDIDDEAFAWDRFPLPELLDIAPTRPDYGDLDLSPTRAARSLPVTRIDII